MIEVLVRVIAVDMLLLFFSRKLAEVKRVRIIVYRNGKCTEPVEVVADLSKLEEVNIFWYYFSSQSFESKCLS